MPKRKRTKRTKPQPFQHDTFDATPLLGRLGSLVNVEQLCTLLRKRNAVISGSTVLHSLLTTMSSKKPMWEPGDIDIFISVEGIGEKEQVTLDKKWKRFFSRHEFKTKKITDVSYPPVESIYRATSSKAGTPYFDIIHVDNVEKNLAGPANSPMAFIQQHFDISILKIWFDGTHIVVPKGTLLLIQRNLFLYTPTVDVALNGQRPGQDATWVMCNMLTRLHKYMRRGFKALDTEKIWTQLWNLMRFSPRSSEALSIWITMTETLKKEIREEIREGDFHSADLEIIEPIGPTVLPYPSQSYHEEKTKEKKKKTKDVKEGMQQMLRKHVICQVCYEGLTQTVVECDEGHLICQQCLKRCQESSTWSDKCPSCRQDMTGEKRNRVVEQMMAELNITVRCQYPDCEEQTTFTEMDAHHKVCVFGQSRVHCPYSFCKKTFTSCNNMLLHIKREGENHPRLSLGEEESERRVLMHPSIDMPTVDFGLPLYTLNNFTVFPHVLVYAMNEVTAIFWDGVGENVFIRIGYPVQAKTEDDYLDLSLHSQRVSLVAKKWTRISVKIQGLTLRIE